MTTARTHQRNVSRVRRAGGARPRTAEPVVAFSAEAVVEAAPAEVESVVVEPDFDPADHTVNEVKDYVAEYPEAVENILELELDGKARSGLLSFLETINDEPEV